MDNFIVGKFNHLYNVRTEMHTRMAVDFSLCAYNILHPRPIRQYVIGICINNPESRMLKPHKGVNDA